MKTQNTRDIDILVFQPPKWTNYTGVDIEKNT